MYDYYNWCIYNYCHLKLVYALNNILNYLEGYPNLNKVEQKYKKTRKKKVGCKGGCNGNLANTWQESTWEVKKSLRPPPRLV